MELDVAGPISPTTLAHVPPGLSFVATRPIVLSSQHIVVDIAAECLLVPDDA